MATCADVKVTVSQGRKWTVRLSPLLVTRSSLSPASSRQFSHGPARL
jgi:hypothetical protein